MPHVGGGAILVVREGLRDDPYASCGISFVVELADLRRILVLSSSLLDSPGDVLGRDIVLLRLFDGIEEGRILLRISSFLGRKGYELRMDGENLASQGVRQGSLALYDGSSSHFLSALGIIV